MGEFTWKGCEQGNIHYPKKCTNQKVSGYDFPIKHFLRCVSFFVHPTDSCTHSRCRFSWYGVATISRMLKNIGLFCKRDLQKRPIFCKETYIFKHPTHRSHPISIASSLSLHMWSQSHCLVPFCSPRIFVCVYTHTHTVYPQQRVRTYFNQKETTPSYPIPSPTPLTSRVHGVGLLPPPPSPFAHRATAKEHWLSGGGMRQRGPRCGPLGAREKKYIWNWFWSRNSHVHHSAR